MKQAGLAPAAAFITVAAAIFFGCVRSTARPENACYVLEGTGGLVNAILQVTRKDCGSNFPWIGNVLDPFTLLHDCSGVLIEPGVVLTTASCVVNKEYFPLVRLGNYDLNDPDEEHEELIGVSEKVIHKNFDGKENSEGDIALLLLQRDARYHKPIGGVVSLEECVSANISSIGWYRSTLSGAPSRKLEAVPEMKSVSFKDCESVFGNLPTDVRCATTDRSPNVAWSPGSPLLCDGNWLIGLMSRARFDSKDNPYVFTHAADYIKWIESKGGRESRKERNQAEECAHTDF